MTTARAKEMRAKVASSLLQQRDNSRRRRMILTYAIVLVFFFIAHSYFSNLDSPLKLIPQTAIAIGMGYLLLLILSLRQFKFIAEFIDWSKVSDSVESGNSPDDGSDSSVNDSSASTEPPSLS